MLLLAAKENSSLGYMTICDTLEAIWIGTSEPTSNTLRWLMTILAKNPDVQEKCYQEICDSIEKYGIVSKDECPFIKYE